MPVTIRDIAKKVGVSPSTVSRVINNKGVISDATRQAVFDAMREMNYHPNSLARSFASQSSLSIGLVMDAANEVDFSNTFFNKSLFAIDKIVQENGYTLVLISETQDMSKAPVITSMVQQKKVDGLILPSSTAAPSLIEKLQQIHFPFVVMGKPNTMQHKCSWVDIDNVQGGALAVSHLADSGYDHFAFIGGNPGTIFVKDRLRGVSEELSARETLLHNRHILYGSEEDPHCSAAVRKALQAPHPPNAFVCCDNILAYHCIRAIKAEGRNCPGEIGVITFDDQPIAAYTEPTMTSVDVDTFQLGVQTAEILLRKLQDDSVFDQHTLLATHLTPRASTQKQTF